MSATPMTDEERRVLLAVSTAGDDGTGAEIVAAQTNSSKDIVLEQFATFLDDGLIEPVRGAIYRITEDGRRCVEQ